MPIACVLVISLNNDNLIRRQGWKPAAVKKQTAKIVSVRKTEGNARPSASVMPTLAETRYWWITETIKSKLWPLKFYFPLKKWFDTISNDWQVSFHSGRSLWKRTGCENGSCPFSALHSLLQQPKLLAALQLWAGSGTYYWATNLQHLYYM